MSFKTITLVLAADLANAGTLDVAYPAGTTRGDFVRGHNHVLNTRTSRYTAPTDFTVTLNASSARITWGSASTLKAGTLVFFQLDRAGPNSYRDDYDFVSIVQREKVFPVQPRFVELGSPVAGAANSISLSQAVNTPAAALLNGTTAGVLDVPRNVVAAWTGTAIATVTGKGVYGETIVEQSASGTSLTGKKAFKSITSVTFNANVTGLTVGTGNVLGLPVWLPNAAVILKEMEDGGAATAGTVVAGLSPATKSTATTADVRGTYVPNSTPDGSKAFTLLLALSDPRNIGNPQFAG